jgi:glutamyl-tRNA synthetase
MVEAGKANGVKMGQVGMPFRLALTGSGQSPAIDSVAHVLGNTTVVRRLTAVIEQLS